MNYFSLEFTLIFLSFLALYWSFRRLHILQNWLLMGFNYFLLIAFFNSHYFAMVVFLYSISIYFAAVFIAVSKSRYALLSCISLMICVLALFKYFPIIKQDWDIFMQFIQIPIDIDLIMPLGLSFYTFASITYLVSVYQGEKIATFHEVTTYLSFFPTIISGPIIRAQAFLKQLRKRRLFKQGNLIFILLMIAIIKKVLIANYLGIYTHKIFENPTNYDIASLICATYAYSIQLYCDFSGYVDLVIAFGLMIGFTLPQNFDMPYASRNLQIFWNKWHMSLSHFIKDYVYIPLGGNKKGLARTYLHIMIAFILSGIWHVNTQDGSNSLNFIIWGALHGIGVCFLVMLKNYKIDLCIPSPIAIFLTFNYVSFCWIFFFLPSFDKSLEYLMLLFANSHALSLHAIWGILGISFALFIYPYTKNIPSTLEYFFALTPTYAKPFLLVCVLLFVFALMPDGIPNFIYSRF